MSEYPDRYVIRAQIAEDSGGIWNRKKGEFVWLYFSHEGGGWWQWGPEGWAYRFPTNTEGKILGALESAPKMGPWYSRPDPDTIEVVAVPAIVTVS